MKCYAQLYFKLILPILLYKLTPLTEHAIFIAQDKLMIFFVYSHVYPSNHQNASYTIAQGTHNVET